MIHPTAIIDSAAHIDAGVSIGAYSIIGADVEIGAGTTIGPHVVIEGPTRIGRDNRITRFASIGGDAQDKKFAGERSELVIGDRNLIREYVTINRGTSEGGGVTRIGHDNWLLAYVHIAHDCQVGNHTVFSSYAGLAGHVEVGDRTIFSSYAGAHQFCKIGAYAFIGVSCIVHGNVPPFVIMSKDHAGHGRPRAVNSLGLKRHGFDAMRIAAIKRAFRTIYIADLTLEQAKAELAKQAKGNPDVSAMLALIEGDGRRLAQ